MAAKTWEQDFRFPAIQASIRALGAEDLDNLFGYPGSFCIPVAERPVIGWTPGRVSLIALILGLTLLGAGALLAITVDHEEAGAVGYVVLACAAACSLLGMVTFFVPVTLDRYIICWLIGDRGRQLLASSRTAEFMTAELSDADSSRVTISIDGDDHLLILFDEENARLMIEGIGARYQIRSKDLVRLAPFEFLNYVGVEIICHIDPQTHLRVAIARVSLLLELIRQLPIFFYLRKSIKNRLLEKCARTLQQDVG